MVGIKENGVDGSILEATGVQTCEKCLFQRNGVMEAYLSERGASKVLFIFGCVGLCAKLKFGWAATAGSSGLGKGLMGFSRWNGRGRDLDLCFLGFCFWLWSSLAYVYLVHLGISSPLGV